MIEGVLFVLATLFFADSDRAVRLFLVLPGTTASPFVVGSARSPPAETRRERRCAPQSQSIELQDSLEVREEYLDLLAILA